MRCKSLGLRNSLTWAMDLFLTDYGTASTKRAKHAPRQDLAG